MFEKFSNLDIDSAGRGGEYVVQVRISVSRGAPFLLTSHGSLGRFRLDKRRLVMDSQQLRQCTCCSPMPTPGSPSSVQSELRREGSSYFRSCYFSSFGRRLPGPGELNSGPDLLSLPSVRLLRPRLHTPYPRFLVVPHGLDRHQDLFNLTPEGNISDYLELEIHVKQAAMTSRSLVSSYCIPSSSYHKRKSLKVNGQVSKTPTPSSPETSKVLESTAFCCLRIS